MSNYELSEEEKKILQKHKELAEQAKERERLFWIEGYPQYSFEEKVKFWSGSLHRQMRWQAESGLDPYAIYDEEWYKEVKVIDPNIDSIMNEVFAKYWSSTGGKWSKEEYYKRINKSI